MSYVTHDNDHATMQVPHRAGITPSEEVTTCVTTDRLWDRVPPEGGVYCNRTVQLYYLRAADVVPDAAAARSVVSVPVTSRERSV